jgi:hypothetical protein
MSSDLLEVVLLAMAAGVVAIDLSLGVIRGRFGTPQRRARLELVELTGSAAVPRAALQRGQAICHGHSAVGLPVVLGIGVLWLDADSVGFLLRRPRRRMEIDLSVVRRAYASRVYERPGFPPVRSATSLLVVEWSTTRGAAAVAWQVDNAQEWAEAIEERRHAAEIIGPHSASVRVA